MAKSHIEDLDYMSDLRAAIVRGPRLSTSLLLFAIVGFIAAAAYWTSQATIPVIARGEGRVIPSSQIQVVQHLEGGILAEILVREGEVVKAGQTLLKVNDIQFESKFSEDYAKYLGLSAARDRLEAEVSGKKPSYSKEVLEGDPRLAESENALYRARRSELGQSVAVLQQLVKQREQELVEIGARITQLDRSLQLAEEELAITEPMVAQGVTSRIELIRIERGVNDIRGTLDAARKSIPRARAAQREAEGRIREKRANYRAQALGQLNDTKVRLNVLGESLTSMRDRVQRTDVRSPVDGTIKQLKINTVGGVIRPGMDLVEIVPAEDNLLIEARIRPADVGFLHPDQEVTVKITAYDYAIFGSLDGRLEQISADSIVDEKGESFFEVRVRTDKNYLGDEDNPKKIIPGMVAQVDIMTGDRTVLDYLLKPILRARGMAFTER